MRTDSRREEKKPDCCISCVLSVHSVFPIPHVDSAVFVIKYLKTDASGHIHECVGYHGGVCCFSVGQVVGGLGVGSWAGI